MSAPARPETGESPRRPRQLRGSLCEVAYREPVGEFAATVADAVAEVPPRGTERLMTLPPAVGASHTSAGHSAAHWMTREQEAIWINDTLAAERSCSTVLWAQRLRGAVAPDAFEGALLDVIGWHESLRSRFLMEDGVPVQCVMVSSGRPVVSERATEADLGERLAALASERLDPADGPLRPTLLRLSDNDWVLAVLLHHLVIDDSLLAFLEREFSRCYRARQQQPDTGAQARLRHRCSLAPTRTPGARPR